MIKPHPLFTMAGYVETIDQLVRQGYAIRDFHNFNPREPNLILRHDIDQSIQVARQMAEVEAEEGWRSTWFVLLRTEMYNPWSAAGTRDLKAIGDMGHEIGLHLDSSLYSADTLEAGAETECCILENIVEKPVRAISFHRPSPDRIGGGERLAGRVNVYAPQFTQDIGYCSDSRGGWYHAHPWDHLAVTERRALHLLTHAIWWGGPEDRDQVGRLSDFLDDRKRVLDQDLAANNAVWARRER